MTSPLIGLATLADLGYIPNTTVMYDILLEQSQVTLQLAVLQQKTKETSILKIVNLKMK